jgi:hypothetical protein
VIVAAMDEDLFSVFDKPEKPQKLPSPAVTDAEPKKKKKKRSPTTPVDGSPAPAPSTKKTKIDRADADPSTSTASAPVLADEFETEAQRKINASGGLQGKVEDGAQVVLSHQVRLLSLLVHVLGSLSCV